MSLTPLLAQVDVDAGLQAHWKLDETTGLLATDSGPHGNDGELLDFADDDSQWVEGQVDGALAFSGSNYIEVPDDLSIGADLVSGFSMATWFRSNVPLAASGSGSRMLEKGNSFFFLQGIVPGGMNFLVKRGGSNITAGIGEDLEADRWYHITGVFDGDEIRVYLDGRQKGAANVGQDIDDAELPLRIGSDDSGAFFNGTMDDVRIWNRPLSELEIKTLAGVGVTGPPVIFSQPVSRSVTAGETVSFSVEADGLPPMSFQWSRDGEAVAGATDATLVLEDVTEAVAGTYTVEVTNAEGSTTSDPATLEVKVRNNLDIVLHYPLDETSGLAANDASGNDFHGELVNFPLNENAHWIAGQVDGGLQMDGVSHIEVSGLPETTSTTWAAWVRSDSEANFQTIIGATFDGAAAGHILGFRNDSNGPLHPRVLWNHNAPNTNITSPNSLTVGEWNHVAATIDADSGEMVLYVNGESVGTANTEASAFTSFHVGRREATSSHYLVGAIDHVRVYDRALSGDEVGQLAMNEAVADGLLVGLNLDETAGLEAGSSFEGGPTGTLVGFEPEGDFWTLGKNEGALNTEGGGYVQVAGLPEMTSTSWAVWVNLNGQPSFGAAISATFDGAAAGHSLGFHSGATAFNPRVLWNHNQGFVSLISPDPVNPGEWNHLALTYNAEVEEMILYVNGEEKQRGSVPTSPFSSINLGRREASGNTPLNAILDDVRIYDRVLSPEDVQSLVGRRTSGPPAITSQPRGVEVFEGNMFSLRVDAEGAEPLSFQWSKDGQELPGETFSDFIVDEAIVDDAGTYSVEVRNSAGSVTSDDAEVTVIAVGGDSVGLVAEYLLDESSGLVAVDASGNGNDGVLMGYADESSHWVTGRIDGGLRIADGGYVDVQLPNLLQSTTWAAWIQLDSEEDFQTAISATFPGANAGHIMGFRSAPAPNVPRVLWNHGPGHTSIQSPDQIPLGEWLHEAVTVDAETGELTLYVNGEIAAQGNVQTTPFNQVRIGQRAATSSFPMGGVIDSVRIYDVVLTPDEILELFDSAPEPPVEPVRITSINRNDADEITLTVSTPEPGFPHILQATSDLAGDWADREGAMFTAGGDGGLTITFLAGGPLEFYRVVMTAPEALFFEDFESGAAGWEHEGEADSWELGTPTNGPGAAFSGSNVFATDLDGNLQAFTNAALLSPPIDLTGVTSATLSFYEFLNIDVSPVFQKTTVNVLDAATLDVLEELDQKSGSVSSWRERRLPLGPDSVGKRIVLEFRISTDDLNLLEGWYIDDVAILP